MEITKRFSKEKKGHFYTSRQLYESVVNWSKVVASSLVSSFVWPVSSRFWTVVERHQNHCCGCLIRATWPRSERSWLNLFVANAPLSTDPSLNVAAKQAF